MRALAAKLDAMQSPEAGALKAKLEALGPTGPATGGRGAGVATGAAVVAGAPAQTAPVAGGRGAGRGGRGGGGRGGAQNGSGNPLDNVATQMIAAAMSMQNADVAPTAREVAAAEEAQRQLTAIMTKWTAIKAEAAALK